MGNFNNRIERLEGKIAPGLLGESPGTPGAIAEGLREFRLQTLSGKRLREKRIAEIGLLGFTAEQAEAIDLMETCRVQPKDRPELREFKELAIATHRHLTAFRRGENRDREMDGLAEKNWGEYRMVLDFLRGQESESGADSPGEPGHG